VKRFHYRFTSTEVDALWECVFNLADSLVGQSEYSDTAQKRDERRWLRQAKAALERELRKEVAE
jgi:hypothetical protein